MPSSTRARIERLPHEAKRIAARVQPIAEAEPGVLGLYLFGSRATGEACPTSDVDLGVLFESSPEVWELLGFEDRLEKALDSKVDLVDLGRASAFLALDIIRGERIYSSDPVACDHFDLYVLRRAADLAPFEKIKRAKVFRRSAGAEE